MGTGSNELNFPLSTESLDAVLDRIAQLLVDEGKNPRADPLSPNQLQAVAELRDQTVRELFSIAMLMQSTAARLGSANPDDRVDDVIAELNATIRSLQRDALEQRCPQAAVDISVDRTRKAKPRFGIVPQRKQRMSLRAPRLDRQDEQECAWAGDITWREVAGLRDVLFAQLEVPGSIGLRLDVREVTSIDGPGTALLIGVNHRATATGRRLVLIDADGPVTAALSRRHVIRDFLVTQMFTAQTSPDDRGPTGRPARHR